MWTMRQVVTNEGNNDFLGLVEHVIYVPCTAEVHARMHMCVCV
jgi:hypothetical protein